MGLVVQKFGGTSVSNTERIFNVANIICETYDRGDNVVVVVSAQGDTTDDLIKKAVDINPNPSKREMDVLLSTGEQISIALLAMALEKKGYPVISLTGWQAGMNTSSKHSNARIKKISSERIKNELDKRKIIIVAGFQGLNKYGDITTLGRGGSDTSAVALAANLGANLCQIYTDVDGIYTADPRIVKNAVKLDEVSFDEMLELATLGAQVLHNRSVELAKKYNINLEVLSSLERKVGTKIKEVVNVEKMLIRGVAKNDDMVRVTVFGLPDESGTAFKLFSTLASAGIDIDVILQSVSIKGLKDISVTVNQQDKDLIIDILKQNQQTLSFKDIDIDEQVSKISIVGAGMQSNPGIAARMFEALFESDVNIQMISTSEIVISVIVERKDAEKAFNAVHKEFIG